MIKIIIFRCQLLLHHWIDKRIIKLLKEEGCMVHISVIEARLSKLGVRISRWFRAEIKELENILMDGEEIIGAVPGRYFGGYAILIATDRRLLLIDKKTFFMNLEDIRYDMISEVDFSSRVFDSTVTLFTLNKQHRFTSTKYKRHLRQLTIYVQQQVMAIRQQQYQQQQSSVAIAPAQEPTMVRETVGGQPNVSFGQHHQHRPAFLRSPHTPKLVGATAMLAARRTAVYPGTSFSTHNPTGFSNLSIAHDF